MISDSGYDSGAEYVARQKNVLLQTYRESQEIDWKVLINDSWLTFYDFSIEDIETYVTLENDTNLYGLPRFDTAIFDKDETEIGTLDKWYWDAWNNQQRPREIGKRTVELDYIGDQIFIKVEDKFLPVHCFKVQGEMVVKKHLVNIQIAAGREIRDFNTNKVEYMQITTAGFNLPQIFATQPGIVITNEEWMKADTPKPNQSILPFQMNPERPYYRIKFSSGKIKQ